MAPATDLSLAGGRPPIRIPKLTYRKRLSALSSYDSPTSSGPSSTPDRASDSPADQPPSTPASVGASTIDFDSRSIASSTSMSATSSDGSISREPKTFKKKKNGVFNFLALKEPSQFALEQFAEAQRKQTTSKSLPGLTVGLQTVSAAKLPPSVPKVNSKWDGVPDSLKSPRTSISTTRKNSLSTNPSPPQSSHKHINPSLGTKPSMLSIVTNDSRGPPNSLASPMQSIVDMSKYKGPESPESLTPVTPVTPSDPSTTADLPEMTFFFPGDSNFSTPVSSPEYPWSPPPRPPQERADPSLDFEQDAQFNEKIVITETEIVDPEQVDVIFKKLKGEPQESHYGNFSTGDESHNVPASHNFLFEMKPICAELPGHDAIQHAPVQPPSTTVPSTATMGKSRANFSRPRPSLFPAHHKNAPALPTVYEVSITSTDDSDSDTITESTDELERPSTRDSTAPSLATSIAPSFSPSMAPSEAPSLTPSVLSASWYQSPRERLGLGGRIRKNNVLPWESCNQMEPVRIEDSTGDVRRERGVHALTRDERVLLRHEGRRRLHSAAPKL